MSDPVRMETEAPAEFAKALDEASVSIARVRIAEAPYYYPWHQGPGLALGCALADPLVQDAILAALPRMLASERAKAAERIRQRADQLRAEADALIASLDAVA